MEMQIKTSMGYVGTDDTYTEKLAADETVDSAVQHIWEDLCQNKVSVSATIISLTEEELSEWGYSAAQENEGVMTAFYYGENYDHLTSELRAKVEEATYSHMDDCAGCGWSYMTESMETVLEDGELYCGRCAVDAYDELNEDEEDV